MQFDMHSSIYDGQMALAAREPGFLRDHVDVYFRDRVRTAWAGGHIMHGRHPDNDSILMVSNDYLSLANHPGIMQAQVDALQGADNTMLMSGVYLHGDSDQTRFERDMADWMGMDAALICQSGYAANVGLLQSIGVAGMPAYVDMFAHASLWEGVSTAKMTPRPFRHNQASHLASLISRFGPGVVMLDSVYSTTGSLAPIREIVEVANANDCVMIIDESHSLGTHGPQGGGLVAELGLQDKVHFVTASLAKAFVGRAGLIACSNRLRSYIKYNSFPAIFSSALLPHDIAALWKTLDIIRNADTARARLHANADYMRSALSDLGYNLDISKAQILGLESGAESQTIVFRDALEARGVFGSVFCAPATAAKRSLIRFSVSSGITQAQMDRVIGVCEEIRDEVDVVNWPSSRRKEQQEAVRAA